MKRRELLKLIPLAGLSAFIPKISLGTVTTSDIEGPFYTPGASFKTKLSPDGAPGTSLFLTGTVYANDCQTPIPNAVIDAWQANDGGDYDNVGYDFRSKFNADGSGNYAIESILPGKYLNGNSFRPRHIHFKVDGMGSPVLTTQLYFEGDTDIPGDPWASDPNAAARIIPLTSDQQGAMHGVWDIVLDVNPPTGVEEGTARQSSHLVNVYPNPMKENGQVNLFLDNPSKVMLQLFDVNGRLMKNVVDENMAAGSHLIWLDTLNQQGLALPTGMYILKLWVNQRAVDAKRFMIS